MQIGGGCKTDFRWEGKCSSPGCCKGGRRKSRRKRGGQKKRKRDRIKAWFNKKFSRKKKDAAVPFIRELMPGREKKLRQVRIPQPGPVQPGKTLTTRDKQRAKKKKKVFADSLNSVFDARLEERDRLAALDAAAQTVNADTPWQSGMRPTTVYKSDAEAMASKRNLLEAMGVLKPGASHAEAEAAEKKVSAMGVGGIADREYEKAVRRKKYLKEIYGARRAVAAGGPPPAPRRKSFGLGGRKRRKTRRGGGRKRRTRRRKRRRRRKKSRKSVR
jgi:hypothetical protein